MSRPFRRLPGLSYVLIFLYLLKQCQASVMPRGRISTHVRQIAISQPPSRVVDRVAEHAQRRADLSPVEPLLASADIAHKENAVFNHPTPPQPHQYLHRFQTFQHSTDNPYPLFLLDYSRSPARRRPRRNQPYHFCAGPSNSWAAYSPQSGRRSRGKDAPRPFPALQATVRFILLTCVCLPLYGV